MLHASSTLPSTLTPIAERLGSNGYFTAGFCNNPLIGVVNTGLHRGFQSFLNYSGWMTSRPNQTAMNLSMFDRYRRHFKRFLADIITSMQDVFAHSDTLLDLSFSPLLTPLWQTALSFKGNTQRALHDAAKLHIERREVEEGQPIFSFINLMGTHMPYHPPARLTDQFAPEVQHDRSVQHYLRQFNSDVFGWLAPLADEIDAKEKAVLDGMYNAEVANQDELVGDFLKQMRESGRLDNTLLIICADHGEHLGEKQLMGHSISLYNELVHVPLIIRDPAGDLPRGSVVDRVVSTRRIFNTILTAADMGTETEQVLTLAQSPTSDPDQECIFALGVTPQNALNVMQRRRPELIETSHCDVPRYALWQERYKLIQAGEGRSELYDIFNDPHETRDLCDILPGQVEVLQERLRAFRSNITVADTVVEQADEYDDPEVYRRLRDLGYLE
jgi:arylsulfatase A-like enzyme